MPLHRHIARALSQRELHDCEVLTGVRYGTNLEVRFEIDAARGTKAIELSIPGAAKAFGLTSSGPISTRNTIHFKVLTVPKRVVSQPHEP